MEEIRYRLNRKKNIAVFEIDTSGPVNTIGEQFIADLVKATEKANSDGV